MIGAARRVLPALAVCLCLAIPATAADEDFETALDDAVAKALKSADCAVATGTIPSCYNRIHQEVHGVAPARAAGAAEDRVEDKTTSAETGTGGATPLRDTLSRLIAGAGIPGLSEEDGSLVFGYNLPSDVFDDEVQVSFKVTAEEPTVYQPLLEVFAEDDRAAKKTALEDRLGQFDDLVLELAGSRLSRRWGRDFDFHQPLFQSLWTQAAARRGVAGVADQAGFLRVINLIECPDDVDPFAVTLERLTKDCRLGRDATIDSLKAELVANARATLRGFAELVRIAEEKGVMEVADLVNNQPQIFFAVEHRARDGELTGPEETTIRFKWEKGYRNVNGLRSYCADRKQVLTDGNGQQQPTLDCVATYLYCDKENPSDCGPNQARKARRISFSAEASEVDAYDFSPEEGVDVVRGGSDSVAVSFAYGWQLTTDAEGTGGTRLDFEASYENVSDDPLKNDRLVGSLTYSQQVAGETAASISLVWAEKPEYLGEVDEKFGARVGLKWTMDPADD